MVERGPVLARLAGFPPRLTLLCIADGALVAQRPVPEAGAGPVALAKAGETLMVAWAARDEVRACRFDAALRPLGDSFALCPLAASAVDRLCGYGGARTAFVATRWPGKRSVGGALSARLMLGAADVEVPQPLGW